MKSITDTILNNRESYLQPTEMWIRYLQDYRSIIIENSHMVNVDLDEQHLYRYRLNEFLYSKSYPREYSWMVLLFNDMSSTQEFNNVSFLFIPNISFVKSIYQDFVSWKAKMIKTTEDILSA